jgi:hypothetical protein
MKNPQQTQICGAMFGDTDLTMFIPITKVDAMQRLVYGIATAEIEDRAGEICDYASTKTHYERWSQEIAQSTGGKSLGNLRAMHGPIAAGKITSISFNDDAKQIEICAKVVDDIEWTKVTEGVYTGFSQGGAYQQKWTDAEGLKRYTAVPNEISLVDFPCLPQARFEMIKVDGTKELRRFGSKPDFVVWRDAIEDVLSQFKNFSIDDLTAESDCTMVVADLQHLSDRLVDILRAINSGEGSQEKAHRDFLINATESRRHKNFAAHKAMHSFAETNANLNTMRSDRSYDDGEYAFNTDSVRLKIEKNFDQLMSILKDVQKRLKNIEDQPLPLPLSGAHRVIAKHEDMSGNVRQIHETNSLLENPETLSILAIKLAQRNGRAPNI